MRKIQERNAIITQLEQISFQAFAALEEHGMIVAAAQDKEELKQFHQHPNQLQEKFKERLEKLFSEPRKQKDLLNLINKIDSAWSLLLIGIKASTIDPKLAFKFKAAFLIEYLKLCNVLPDCPPVKKCTLHETLSLYYYEQKNSLLHDHHLDCAFGICLKHWEEEKEVWLQMAYVLCDHYISHNAPGGIQKAERLLDRIRKTRVRPANSKGMIKSYEWRIMHLKTCDQKQTPEKKFETLPNRIRAVLEEAVAFMKEYATRLPTYSADLKTTELKKRIIISLLKKSPVNFDKVLENLMKISAYTEKYSTQFIFFMLQKELLTLGLECNAYTTPANRNEDEMMLLSCITGVYASMIQYIQNCSPTESNLFKREFSAYLLSYEENSRFSKKKSLFPALISHINSQYPTDDPKTKNLIVALMGAEKLAKEIRAPLEEQKKESSSQEEMKVEIKPSLTPEKAPLTLNLELEKNNKQEMEHKKIQEEIAINEKALTIARKNNRELLKNLEKQKKNIESLEKEIEDLDIQKQKEEKEDKQILQRLKGEEEKEKALKIMLLDLENTVQPEEKEITALNGQIEALKEKIALAQKQKAENEKNLLETEKERNQASFELKTEENISRSLEMQNSFIPLQMETDFSWATQQYLAALAAFHDTPPLLVVCPCCNVLILAKPLIPIISQNNYYGSFSSFFPYGNSLPHELPQIFSYSNYSPR